MATRGRPAFKPTAAQRRQVEELVSCSMAENAIARVLGIHVDTMRVHFADELLHGRERRRAEVVRMLYKSARSGNVTAQKKLEDMTGIAAAAAELDEREADGRSPPPAKRGKKEEINDAAAKVAGGGIFAVPAAPKLVVDNR